MRRQRQEAGKSYVKNASGKKKCIRKKKDILDDFCENSDLPGKKHHLFNVENKIEIN